MAPYDPLKSHVVPLQSHARSEQSQGYWDPQGGNIDPTFQ